MPGTEVRKISVVWTGLPGGPYLSQLFFEWQSAQANTAATAVNTFLTALKPNFAIALTATQQADQEIIDTATGKIVSLESATPPAPVFGSSSGEPLPVATQGLIRLFTNTFNNGRRLQGRMYVPGPTEGVSTVIPTTAYTSGLDTAANALRTSSASWGPWAVYSRRYQGWASIGGVSTWGNWAIQRRRRD